MAVNGTTFNSITSYKFKHTSIFKSGLCDLSDRIQYFHGNTCRDPYN